MTVATTAPARRMSVQLIRQREGRRRARRPARRVLDQKVGERCDQSEAGLACFRVLGKLGKMGNESSTVRQVAVNGCRIRGCVLGALDNLRGSGPQLAPNHGEQLVERGIGHRSCPLLSVSIHTWGPLGESSAKQHAGPIRTLLHTPRVNPGCPVAATIIPGMLRLLGDRE